MTYMFIGTFSLNDPCADPEILSEEVQHIYVFFSFLILVDKGREDPTTNISGPSWRFAGGPMVAQD